jgi:hypothetical protein
MQRSALIASFSMAVAAQYMLIQMSELLVMNAEEFISNARVSFAMLRWTPLVAIVSLPFTFAHGPIPAALFGRAVIIAATCLLLLLFAWRTRSQLLWALGSAILMFGPRLVGVNNSGVPESQVLQWLCYVLILTGTPLLFFRARLFHFARLDELNVS